MVSSKMWLRIWTLCWVAAICLHSNAWCEAQELSPLQQRLFDRLDSNKDGSLDKSELPERLQQAFSMIDGDRDENISKDEFVRVTAKFSRGKNSKSGESARKKPEPFKYYGSSDQQLKIDRIEKLVLHDADRDKELQIRITYPLADGPFPVIVFSHGLYGSKDNYLPLTEFWASQGYVVFQANHADSRKLGTKIGDPRALRSWGERPLDVSLVIDSLKALNKENEKLKSKFDLAKIGVGGHSFGANTTQLIAGAVAKQGRKTRTFGDTRVSAALLMSGQGPGEMLTNDSWKKISMPMMVFSGSKDGPTRTGHPAEWRKKPYELSPPGDKYLVWVEGLDHGYGDITGSGRLAYNAEHIAYTQATTLAFWDAYLKKSATPKSFLRDKTMSKETDNVVAIEWK